MIYDFSSASSSGAATVTIHDFVMKLGGVLQLTADPITVTPDSTPNDTFAVTAATTTETLSQTLADPTQVQLLLTTGSGASAVTTVLAASQYTISGNTLTLKKALTQPGTLTVVYFPTIAIIGNATATILPLNNLMASVSNLVIQKTGVQIENASVTLSDLTIANIFSITAPTLSFHNIVFLEGTAGGASSFTGTAQFTSTGATLNLGSATLSVTHDPLMTADSPANLALSGAYDFSTQLLQFSLEHVTATLPLASLDATGVMFSYAPAADGSATMLLGAHNVTLTVGTAGTGLQVSSATLALEVFKDTGGNVSFALDATGTVALIGLPANSLTLSGQMEVKIDNIPGTTGLLIPLSSAPNDTILLSLTGSHNEVQGTNLTLGIGGVVTLHGDFFVTSSNGKALISVTNFSAFLGTTDQSMGLQISGGSLGLEINSDSTYAVDATVTNFSLIGFSNFTLNGSLELKVNTTAAAVNDPIPVAGNGPAFNLTVAVTPLTIGGSVTLQIANFVTLKGTFGFTESAPVTLGTVTTTQLLVAATIDAAFLGSGNPADPNDPNNKGIFISGGQLGLLLIKKTDTSLTVQAPAAYALDATVTASIQGIPGLTLSGASLQVRANTTGAAVVQTVSGVLLNFPDATNVLDIEGTLSSTNPLTISGFVSVSGNFTFTKSIDPANPTLTKILVGATNVTATLGSTSFGVQLTSGTLALAIYNDTSLATPSSYALDASGTLTLNGVPGVTFTGNFDARVNTRPATTGVNETINVGGTPVTLQFAPGTGSTASIIGTGVTLSVGTFASVSGNFSIVQNGNDYDISASNINATVGVTQGTGATATFTGIQITGASLGLLLRSGGYAVVVNGGNDSIQGVPGLTVTANSLTVKVDTLGIITGQTIGGVLLDFPNGNVTDVEGSVMLSVANFANLQGSFVFQKTTDSVTNVTTFVVAATGVTATVGTSSVNLSVTIANLGMVIRQPATGGAAFAVMATGGSATFTGLADFPLGSPVSITGIKVLYNNTGLSGTGLLGAGHTTITTTGGSVDFSTLTATDAAQVQFHIGNVNSGVITNGLTIGGFAKVAGDFAISEQVASTSVTKILIGATGVTAFVGTSDGSYGLELSSGMLGMVVFTNSKTGVTNYALSASGNVQLVGFSTASLGSGITLSATASLLINTTGAAVAETIQTSGGVVSVNFTDGTNSTVDQTFLKTFSGSLTLGIGGFLTLSGNFTLTIPPPVGNVSQILLGATNVTVSANDGINLASITNGSFGLIITHTSGSTPTTTFALMATGTVTLAGAISATATVFYNTGPIVTNVSVSAGGSPLLMNVPAATGTTPYEKVQINNASITVPGLGAINIDSTGKVTTTPSPLNDINLGGVFQLQGVTISGNLSHVGATWTGTVTITVGSAVLFPNESFSANLTVQNATLTLTTDASFNITSYQIKLGVNFALAVGQAFQINAGSPGSPVTLTYNYSSTGPAQTGQTLFTAPSLTVSSPMFGVSGTITNLVLKDNGFQFDSVSLTGTNVNIGGVLHADSITLSSGAFAVSYGPPVTLTGASSLTMTITGLQLFPGGFLTTTVNPIDATHPGTVTGVFDFSGFVSSGGAGSTGAFSINIPTGITLTMGQAFALTTGAISITPGQQVIASIASASLTFLQFNSLPQLTITNLQFTQSGFSLGSATLTSQSGSTPGIGNFLTFGSLTISLSTFSYSNLSTYTFQQTTGGQYAAWHCLLP